MGAAHGPTARRLRLDGVEMRAGVRDTGQARSQLLMRDGPLCSAGRLTLVLSCAMNFHYYPHDMQQCSMKIESCEYLQKGVDGARLRTALKY